MTHFSMTAEIRDLQVYQVAEKMEWNSTGSSHSPDTAQNLTDTVFPRINAAAFIKFFMIWVRRLFKGGVYSRAAFI